MDQVKFVEDMFLIFEGMQDIKISSGLLGLISLNLKLEST